MLGRDGEIGIAGSCRRGLTLTPAGLELISGALPCTVPPTWGLRDVKVDAGSEEDWVLMSTVVVASTPLMLALPGSPAELSPSPGAVGALANGSAAGLAKNPDTG